MEITINFNPWEIESKIVLDLVDLENIGKKTNKIFGKNLSWNLCFLKKTACLQWILIRVY